MPATQGTNSTEQFGIYGPILDPRYMYISNILTPAASYRQTDYAGLTEQGNSGSDTSSSLASTDTTPPLPPLTDSGYSSDEDDLSTPPYTESEEMSDLATQAFEEEAAKNYEAALKSLKAIISMLDANKDIPHDETIFVKAAELNVRLGHNKDAAANYGRAIDIAKSPLEKATLLEQKAKVSQGKEAEQDNVSAIKLYERAGNIDKASVLANLLTDTHPENSTYALAKAELSEPKTTQARKNVTPEKRQEIIANYKTVGLLFTKEGDHEQAAKMLGKLSQLYKGGGDKNKSKIADRYKAQAEEKATRPGFARRISPTNFLHRSKKSGEETAIIDSLYNTSSETRGIG